MKFRDGSIRAIYATAFDFAFPFWVAPLAMFLAMIMLTSQQKCRFYFVIPLLCEITGVLYGVAAMAEWGPVNEISFHNREGA